MESRRSDEEAVLVEKTKRKAQPRREKTPSKPPLVYYHDKREILLAS